MKFVLDGHCIETEARRQRDRLMKEILSSADEHSHGPGVHRDLELLTDFLTGTDFRALRARRAELDGSRRLTVEIMRTENGKVVIIEEETP
jgi:hypothetical protein